ncbi:MAG: TonB-dependent receptor plug domain-containing protein, partial [Pseudomonadota bacterium]
MFRKTTLHLMMTAAMTTTAAIIPLSTHAQQTGVIRGTVTDESGDYRFSDALVSIPGASRSVVTDRSGRFRLDDLPAGEYTVRVTYQGGTAQDVTVVLEEGETENLTIEVSGASERGMPEVLVRGIAAGQLSALNRRRNAESLIDVLSSDSVGQFPDQNLAEALQRATGMSVQRDQGEGRYVVIRGIDPKFNSTTINGLRIPGPENDSRAVNLDVISSDLIQTVEVSKAVTPDMDGDAVGGNIEIKTLTAFDLPAGFAKITAGGSYNATNGETSPDIAGTYTNVFSLGDGMDNLGVAFSFSKFDRKTVSDGIEGGAWPVEEGPDGQEYRMLEEGEQRDYILTRDRTSLALNFDYRPSEDTDLYLRTLYSEFDDYETKLENVYIFEAGDIESLSADGGRFTGAEMEKKNSDSNKVQTITSISLGGETRLRDWTVDYSLGHSTAGEEGAISEIGGAFIAE